VLTWWQRVLISITGIFGNILTLQGNFTVFKREFPVTLHGAATNVTDLWIMMTFYQCCDWMATFTIATQRAGANGAHWICWKTTFLYDSRSAVIAVSNYRYSSAAPVETGLKRERIYTKVYKAITFYYLFKRYDNEILIGPTDTNVFWSGHPCALGCATAVQ